MKYPACYIFLCDTEEYSRIPGISAHRGTGPDPTGLMGIDKLQANPVLQPDLNRDIEACASKNSSEQIRTSVIQDSCVTAGLVKRYKIS